MEILQAVVLGVVQGITEFLPISSDGHLILVPSLMGWERFGLGFDVMLHMGTLAATVIYFRRDLLEIAMAIFSKDPGRSDDRRLGWLILGATVPSAAIALAADPLVSGVEDMPVLRQITITAVFLLATAAVLTVAELISRRAARHADREEIQECDLPWWKSLSIGVLQGFAVAPGLSRSGMTIAGGVALGMTRERAARFSFLLSVPIIAAATAKKILLDVIVDGAPLGVGWPSALVAVAVTALTGYAAIAFLLPFVRKHSLMWFAAYAGALGVAILVYQAIVGGV